MNKNSSEKATIKEDRGTYGFYIGIDLGDKATDYLQLTSLATYLILAQDEVKAWVYSRDSEKRFPASAISLAGSGRLLDRPAALGPILESAEIENLPVAHLLEQLAGQSRAPARAAIQDQRLVL